VQIGVYTAITAGKDSLKDPPLDETADLIFFTDRGELFEDSRWNIRPACDLFKDPRRNSRAHKILAHQYLADYDYSLWIDGSVRLLASARELAETYLRDADIAMFRHPARSCLYVEADGLIDAGYSQKELSEQVTKYRRHGHPPNSGLNECAVILRRHNDATAAFNAAWWAEYCRHSCRDQVSVSYVLRKLGVRVALLPGAVHDNPGIVYLEDHLWR
jgi:hypothetical protein